MVKIDDTEPRVVNYHEFAFSQFWQNRDYDHRAEVLTITKYFKKYFVQRDDEWLLDVGGSFGRLLPAYKPYFDHVAIVDYVVNEFHLAEQTAREANIKLELLAANAYHLPFKNDSQSAVIAVRLVHYLEDPLWFFEEVARVLEPGGLFICQTASKNHFKTLLYCLIKFDFSVWRLQWLDLGSKGVQEDGHFVLLRNYKPSYLEALMKEVDLEIVHRRSVSWLRNIQWLQKIPLSFHVLERFLQWLSPFMLFGPSNWYILKKPGQPPQGKRRPNFASTLCSPENQKPLPKNFKTKYQKKTAKKAVYLDLRYPKS